MLHYTLRVLSYQLTRLVELSLLNMAPVDLEELPLMPVCLYDPAVLDRRIDIVHVFKAPKSCTDSLRDRKRLTGERSQH